MKKLFADVYTDDDVLSLQAIALIAVAVFGIMVFISSSMGIYL